MDETQLRDGLNEAADGFQFRRETGPAVLKRSRTRVLMTNAVLALAVVAAGVAVSTAITSWPQRDIRQTKVAAKPEQARYAGHIALTGRTRGAGAADQVWMADLSDGSLTQLVNAPLGTYAPSWSPDGRSLLYVRQTSSGPSIMRMKLKGRRAREVTSAPSNAVGPFRNLAHPTWSPDGKTIAFVSYVAGQGDIHILGPNGQELTVADSPLLENSPSWSPDGQQIAFSRQTDNEALAVFVTELATGRTRQISRGSLHQTLPAWSPDGTQIAVISYRGSTGELSLLDPETGDLTLLAEGVSRSYSPSWSMDGSSLVFVSRDGRTIELIRADGTGRKRLELNLESAVEPSWRPSSD